MTMFANKKYSLPIIVSLILGFIASYCSIGYFHLDEHYQILEFLSYKLGRGGVKNLPWEYQAQIRPWIQPFFYFILQKFFSFFGNFEPLTMERVYRVLSMLLFQISIWRVTTYCSSEYLKSEQTKLFFKWFMALFWVFPFIGARISSEALGGSLFFLGLIGSLEALKSNKNFHLFINCLLLGIAVWIRFQLGAAVFGFLIWYGLFSKVFDVKKFGVIVAGGVLAAMIGILIDFWGYDEWVITPLKYFSRNILEGEAAKHGVTPWWEYFYVAQKKLHPGFGVLFVLSVLVFWGQKIKDVFSITTIFFFLMHMLTSHKELRFLIPMATLIPFFVVWSLENLLRKTKLKNIPAKLLHSLAIIFLAYQGIASFVAATRVQYQGVHLLNFLQHSKIEKLYTFSTIPMKMMTHNIIQSYYGKNSFDEILVSNFNEIQEEEAYYVAARGGVEAIKFQQKNCVEIFPKHSRLYFLIHYSRKFHKQDYYSVYKCQ